MHVDSCRTCPNCREGLEQYCDNELTLTYNSPDRRSGGMTYGGYSDRIRPYRATARSSRMRPESSP